MTLAPGRVVDRYVVERLLGRGGMAVVYLVRHRELDSRHALKVLTLTSPAIRQRLRQEGRVQARLRHPNIVNVTDLVEVDGAPGLVMEFVDGRSLDALLEAPMDDTRRESLALGILEGVREAHRHGLVHRDLKPANILVDARGVPKITDFGLVKIAAGEVEGAGTRSGVAMGTPFYMAPEQIRDAKTVDARADVFSLGAVLFELMTGERPFGGKDTLDLFNAIAQGRRLRLRDLRPDLPDRIHDAIEGALQVELDRRWPSCEALLSTWCDRPLDTAPPLSTPVPISLGDATPAGLVVAAAPTLSVLAPAQSEETWAPPAELSMAPDAGQGLPPGASEPVFVTEPARRFPWAYLGGALVLVAVLVPLVVVGGRAWLASGAAPVAGGRAEVPAVVAAEGAPRLSEAPPAAPPLEGSPLGERAASGVAAGAASAPVASAGAASAPAPSTTPMRPAPSAPAPSTAASSAAAASTADAGAAAPSTPAPAASSPAASPTAPPAEVSAPPASAHVVLTGDAQRIRLEGSAGTFGAGDVPPGRYEIYAVFGGAAPVPVGTLTLAAGERRTLRCDGAMMACR